MGVFSSVPKLELLSVIIKGECGACFQCNSFAIKVVFHETEFILWYCVVILHTSNWQFIFKPSNFMFNIYSKAKRVEKYYCKWLIWASKLSSAAISRL